VPPIPGIFTENKVPMKMADWVLVYMPCFLKENVIV
jgi:hypothetical protein